MIKAFFLFLFFSPLLYTFDHDELREEKVLAVAAAATLFLFFCALRTRAMISNIKEIVIVSLFSLLIIVQQSFVDRGSLSFGTKYALVLLATFVPYWVAHTLRLGPELRRTATFAIGLLFLVTAITISTSYAFGVGEFYVQDGKTVRAFGWLGDSFTPVIVFLVIYYCFRRQLVLALLSFAMLLLTGGKAATFMLITMPVLVFFSNASRRMKVIVAVLSLVLLLVVLRLAAPIVETKMPLPVVEYSVNTRLLSIYNGLNYFLSAPWTGVGVNQSMKFVDVDSAGLAISMGIDSYYEVHQIHNAIIRTAAETGVLGLALLLLFFYVLLSLAYRRLRASQSMSDPCQRAIVQASSLWVIAFVLFYQTTGWFEAGHPQLSWLLLFSTVSSMFSRRPIDRGVVVGDDIRPYAHPNVRFRPG